MLLSVGIGQRSNKYYNCYTSVYVLPMVCILKCKWYAIRLGTTMTSYAIYRYIQNLSELRGR